MSEPTPFQRTFQHAMELWFEPEIKRRQDAGLIPKPYGLKAAQVIIHADSRPNEVRLNEEVAIMAGAKVKEGANKAIGDYLSLNEIDGIEKWYLPESENSNCGHFTVVSLAGNWYCTFDFRYNKAQSRALLAAAEEFLSVASYALATNMLRATADNLFSAAELAAKAYVITTPLPGASTSKKHGFFPFSVQLAGTPWKRRLRPVQSLQCFVLHARGRRIPAERIRSDVG